MPVSQNSGYSFVNMFENCTTFTQTDEVISPKSIDFFGERIYYVPNCIDAKYFQSLIDNYTKHVYKGYITVHKAREGLINIIKNHVNANSSHLGDSLRKKNLYISSTCVYERQAVTKQYDHSKGIDLKKYPIYYVSNKDGKVILGENTSIFYDKVTTCWRITYITEDNYTESMQPLNTFAKEYLKMDQTCLGYDYEAAVERTKQKRINTMTAEQFFNQKKYSKNWNSYDLVSNPGFTSAVLSQSNSFITKYNKKYYGNDYDDNKFNSFTDNF